MYACVVNPKTGAAGTQTLVKEYGERLLRVRYRYDALKRKRCTTAEVIVDKADWGPLPSEVARREKVKAACGRRGPARRVWLLSVEQVRQFGLSERTEQQRSL